ncbi:MAG: hypothetical protein JW795_17285, partial [Chitinivibrionales bacterium]|nr:hypothetical protein [Chitinivibrionales bacterium]
GAQRFGMAKSQLSVRLPILVQPALPRFVRIGDRFLGGGTGRVVEGDGGEGQWLIETDGLTMAQFQHSSTSGIQSCQLSPGRAISLMTPMAVADPGYADDGHLLSDSITVTMKLLRKQDTARDGFSVKIPLRMDRSQLYADTFGQLSAGARFGWNALSSQPRPHTLHRQLLVTSQLPILKALSGLSHLMRFSYECTEQRISKAFPSLVYTDIFQQWGLPSPNPSVKEYVAGTLSYLSGVQTPDGLFGYWPGSTGYVYLTAYVTEFLMAVRKANAISPGLYPVDEQMIDRALAALKRSLRSDYEQFVSGYAYFERSAALHALASAGQADIAYLRQLSGQTANVDVQSQARILSAIGQAGQGLRDEKEDLEKRLWQQTVFKLQDGKEVFGGLQQRSFAIGAQVHGSEISALATMVSAFSDIQSNPAKVDQMMQELMGLTGPNGWGNTSVNSTVLLSIRDYIAHTKQQATTADIFIARGTGREQLKANEKTGVAMKNWQDNDAGAIQVERLNQNQPLYLRFVQQYIPRQPGSTISMVQRGFVVKRELIRIQKKSPHVKMPLERAAMVCTLSVGDIIEEHIQVQNPQKRFFAVVCAPLAAGLEPMNPNLETASQESKPAGGTTDAFQYQEMLDDRVAYYFHTMEAGTFDFYYRLRATTSGTFTQPPAEAQLMYEQAVFGASSGATIFIQ